MFYLKVVYVTIHATMGESALALGHKLDFKHLVHLFRR